VSIASIRLVILLSLVLGAAACGSTPAATAKSPPAPSPTLDAAAVERCQLLLQRGVTPCPPANLALERIAIRNGTHGAVTDAVARDEGIAYLRVHALYGWAVRQDAGDAFLVSGAIVRSETGRTNIFRAEIRLFNDARAVGGRALVDPLVTTAITLVTVPATLLDAARQDGLQPSPFAWVDNQAGPGRASIELPDGRTQDEVRIGAGQPHPILVFGQLKDDAELGSIWYLGGEYGCLAIQQVRVVCGV
jgi:hypothetical protein